MDGREVTLPFASTELSIRRASSSFLLLQTFGAHVLWGLETPAAYITLQPAFADKVSPSPQLCCTTMVVPGGGTGLGSGGMHPGYRGSCGPHPELHTGAAGAGALRHLQLEPAG